MIPPVGSGGYPVLDAIEDGGLGETGKLYLL
jgi:hypothetical protein